MARSGKADGDVDAQLLGFYWQTVSHCWMGDFVAARTDAEQFSHLSASWTNIRDAAGFEEPSVITLATLAVTLTYLGCVDQGRSELDKALAAGRVLKHPPTMIPLLFISNWANAIIALPDLQSCEELLALSIKHGYTAWVSWATVLRGRVATLHGRSRDGLALLDKGLAEMRANEFAHGVPMVLIWIAETHAALGEATEGLRFLSEAAKNIEITEERCHEGELLRTYGYLLHLKGDQLGAELNYRQAISVAERQGGKLLQLRASVSLARLWRDQGESSEARDLLGPIYNWFTEGFDAPDLKDAKALLEQLTP